ncbi:hypothetical protein AWB80_04417 [Caballeronia pedi]|uniref:DUF6708 domain-containing protein n=2 Tax=Caballeronia pedi TaxID=1777141 RepID=A0A158C133_9BURK|nr:hypothetical protein AWB80_04417 [Caballeronia pedi]
MRALEKPIDKLPEESFKKVHYQTTTGEGWRAGSKHANVKPQIGEQFVAISQQCLEVQSVMSGSGVTLARMWSVLTFYFTLFVGYALVRDFVDPIRQADPASLPFLLADVAMLTIDCFLIFAFKRLSNIVFNRHTQRVYGMLGKNLWQVDWKDIQATTETDLGVYGAVTHPRLQLNLKRVNKWGKLETATQVFRLAPHNNTDIISVWEYVRTFMEEGPDLLPIPTKRDWFQTADHKISFTPMEAWRHYAPWPLVEPTDDFERTAKVRFWPIWTFFSFPYCMAIALPWWLVVKICWIHLTDLPSEAWVGNIGPMITPEMAAKGMRP